MTTEHTPHKTTDSRGFSTEVEHELEDQNDKDTPPNQEQAEPVSFEEILLSYPTLLKQIQQMGFSSPTPVQRIALPRVLEGKDVVVQAATGSGKTLVFVLGMIAKMLREKNAPKNSTYALILAPTRELAVQITNVIRSLDPSLSPSCIIGGESMQQQIDHLKEDARIVVGTPGRIRDVLRRPLNLNTCRFFVLDEADEMLSIGFLQDVRAILSRLPDQRQGVFVSATISPRVEMLASAFLTKPNFLAVARDIEQIPAIEHYCVSVGNDLLAKPSALCDIIETERPLSAIIFCNTRSDTKLVEAFLRRRGFDARRINSDLTQKQRRKIMDQIRDQDLQFLVATDVAARGIDLEHIEIVINYTIHDQPEIYVHRTGRTGRAGRHGRAFSLVSARDFQAFHNLKKTLEFNFKEYRLPTNEELAGAKLAHLYEIIRKAKIDIGERDIILAKNLLAELSPASTHSEDQELFIAKLSKYVFEHFLSRETGSLDEEIADESGRVEEAEELSSPRSSRRERHDRPYDNREDRRGEDSRADRREDRRDDRRSQSSRSRGGHQDSRRENTRHQEEDHRRTDHRENKPISVEEEQVVRVYVGQGTNHGLTPAEFCSLAAEFAELSQESILNLSIRDNYLFVDLKEENANKLIENLNGIEFNGESLPVELATVLARAEGHHNHSRDRERSGYRHHRNDRHNYNNRTNRRESHRGRDRRNYNNR